MKNLKSLVQKLVKEAITNKIGEGQPVGGIKNDHDFDAGRHGVMKAVNIGEGNEDRPCDCGSGQMSRWEKDGQGIPLCRACPKCRKDKLSKYRPEILRPYSQSDVDEPIEPDKPDSFQEKVGFDGKYVDDMDSGTKVKRIEGLKEEDAQQPWREVDNNFFIISDKYAHKLTSGMPPKPGNERLITAPKGFKTKSGFVWLAQTVLHNKTVWSIRDSKNWVLKNGLAVLSGQNIKEVQDSKQIARQIKKKELIPYYPENFKQVPNYIRIKKKVDTQEFVVYWYVNGKVDEKKSYFTDDLVDAWNTFAVTKMEVDKANSKVSEESGTGAAGGYQTPFAFKKKKKVAENDEQHLRGKFIDRGTVTLQSGIDYKLAEKIANHLWDIFGTLGTENGVYHFKTRGDRYCCSVGMLNGKPAVLNITTTSGRLQLLVGDEIGISELSEQTSTGAVAGYQTPFAFSKKKQGSSRAIAAAKKYGTVVKSISENIDSDGYKPIDVNVPKDVLLSVKWGTEKPNVEYGIAKFVHGKWWRYGQSNPHANARECATPTGWQENKF